MTASADTGRSRSHVGIAGFDPCRSLLHTQPISEGGRLPHTPSGGLTQWRAANVRVIGLINERVTVLTISGKLPTASAANGLLAAAAFPGGELVWI